MRLQVYFRKHPHCIEHITFFVDEHEFNITRNPKLNGRPPQYSMTNDPEKVWPGGIVHYGMDASISEFVNAHPSIFVHALMNDCYTRTYDH